LGGIYHIYWRRKVPYTCDYRAKRVSETQRRKVPPCDNPFGVSRSKIEKAVVVLREKKKKKKKKRVPHRRRSEKRRRMRNEKPRRSEKRRTGQMQRYQREVMTRPPHANP
jgi:hypothetical protein